MSWLRSRRTEQVEEAAAAIEAKGVKTLRLTSDVVDRASRTDARMTACIQAFGKVDILINCAGKIKRAATLDFPEDQWDDIMDTNVTGTLRACQIFGKTHDLRQTHAGSGLRPHHQHRFPEHLRQPERSDGVRLFEGRCWRPDEVRWPWSGGRQGVTVNAIAPGVFRTALNTKLLDESDRGKELA